MTDKINHETLNQVLRIIPMRIKEILKRAMCSVSGVQEIVLRSEKPLCVYTLNGLMFLTNNGCLTKSMDSQPLVVTDAYEVADCFNCACGYSVYSHINEIKEGFVTISGGHRVGLSGTAVVSSEEITNIRDISTVSIRVCREIKGCGEEVVKLLRETMGSIILCGIPCSGKTTVLRDVARLLSVEEMKRVTVVDTRGEIASSYKAKNQMDVGLCDVMNGYPRAQGVMQAVKVFSPEYILCDEVGTEADSKAIINGINSGVRFVITSHAKDYEELIGKDNIKTILKTGVFSKAVFLKGKDDPGKIESVVDIKKESYA